MIVTPGLRVKVPTDHGSAAIAGQTLENTNAAQENKPDSIANNVPYTSTNLNPISCNKLQEEPIKNWLNESIRPQTILLLLRIFRGLRTLGPLYPHTAKNWVLNLLYLHLLYRITIFALLAKGGPLSPKEKVLHKLSGLASVRYSMLVRFAPLSTHGHYIKLRPDWTTRFALTFCVRLLQTSGLSRKALLTLT